MADGARHESLRWIEEHGDDLFRYALVRVRNADAAEDLVQETFLAALQAGNPVEGPFAERRWMMGIMKHKVIDYFRRSAREPIHESNDQGRFTTDDDMTPDGHWTPEAARAPDWPHSPDHLLDRKQFRAALAGCLGTLPPRTAQVFTLREVDELDTGEICRLLNITPTNFGVMLHRARKHLRDCLNRRYFGRAPEALSS
jgi:RNA polymerase sigma-70 factor, ECF subfamily